jgi:hypothetical protein
MDGRIRRKKVTDWGMGLALTLRYGAFSLGGVLFKLDGSGFSQMT